jgi:hypothetical protein
VLDVEHLPEGTGMTLRVPPALASALSPYATPDGDGSPADQELAEEATPAAQTATTEESRARP